jgi:transcriptional regulator of arginine metabolism
MTDPRNRRELILELIRTERIASQEELRALLAARGFRVAQATLSRDLRTLGIAKAPDDAGHTRYTLPPGEPGSAPALARLLPVLFVSAEGTGQLLVVRTRTGAAQPVAEALDREGWPELLGTIAGDNTILIILRHAAQLEPVTARLQRLATG